jgi:hypothetical protein
MAGHCYNERIKLIIEVVEVRRVLLIVNDDKKVQDNAAGPKDKTSVN